MNFISQRLCLPPIQPHREKEKESIHRQNHCDFRLKKITDTNTTSMSTTTASTNSDPTNEVDVGNKIMLYQYFFIQGFIRVVTREENNDLETLILDLNETMKEVSKMIRK